MSVVGLVCNAQRFLGHLPCAGAQPCATMRASCSTVHCYLHSHSLGPVQGMAELLQPLCAPKTMVFISSAKHLQLCAVSLLGCGSIPILQDAAGILFNILRTLLL